MSTTLTELQAYAIAGGLGTAATIFAGPLPELPNDCASIIETGGTGPDRRLGDNFLEETGFQFMARAVALSTARANAMAAVVLFEAVVNQMVGSTRYLRIETLGSPSFVGRDANQRALYSANFMVLKEQS